MLCFYCERLAVLDDVSYTPPWSGGIFGEHQACPVLQHEAPPKAAVLNLSSCFKEQRVGGWQSKTGGSMKMKHLKWPMVLEIFLFLTNQNSLCCEFIASFETFERTFGFRWFSMAVFLFWCLKSKQKGVPYSASSFLAEDSPIWWASEVMPSATKKGEIKAPVDILDIAEVINGVP